MAMRMKRVLWRTVKVTIAYSLVCAVASFVLFPTDGDRFSFALLWLMQQGAPFVGFFALFYIFSSGVWVSRKRADSEFWDDEHKSVRIGIGINGEPTRNGYTADGNFGGGIF